MTTLWRKNTFKWCLPNEFGDQFGLNIQSRRYSKWLPSVMWWRLTGSGDNINTSVCVCYREAWTTLRQTACQQSHPGLSHAGLVASSGWWRLPPHGFHHWSQGRQSQRLVSVALCCRCSNLGCIQWNLMLEQNQTKDTSLHVKCRKYPNISICKLCSINIYTKGVLFWTIDARVIRTTSA